MNGNEFKSLIFPVMVSLLIVIIFPIGSANENENYDAISDLVLDKAANPGLYHIGDSLGYTLFIYNQNLECTYEISRIWDEYPDGHVEEFIADLPLVLGPGETYSLEPEYVYVVKSTDISDGYVINSLSASFINDCGGDGTITILVSTPIVGSIGDYVWLDENGDTLQDAGEAGMPGVLVELYQDGELLATNVTDSNGNYFFTDLFAGTYTVNVNDSTVPDYLELTTLPEPRVVDLDAGEENLDVDFGYKCTSVIGDYIWRDIDGDALQDSTESGIPGIVVELYKGGMLVATNVTDSNGNYLFTGLCEGTYTVDVNDSTLPEGMFLTTPPEPRNFALSAGEENLDVDFGYKLPCECEGVIGDNIWMDMDSDGVYDVDESGIEGVIVELYQDNNGDGVIDAGDNLLHIKLTDPTGKFLFQEICAGNYIVSVVEGTLPDDVELVTGPEPYALEIESGEQELDVDFGYTPISGTIVPSNDLSKFISYLWEYSTSKRLFFSLNL